MTSEECKAYKEEFQTAVHQNITRPGIDSLMNAIEQTDFYEAPASTQYHSCEEGGLVVHSLAVWKQLQKLNGIYNLGATPESMAVCGLFHDLCKADTYAKDYRNAKNAFGAWEKVPYFKHNEKLVYGGHGAKSVFLLMSYIPLSAEEASAIHCHMGAWDKSDYMNPGRVYEWNSLAWALHVADEAATYLEKK